MCWEALGPYHSWDKILLCAQSLIRMKIPEDMIQNPKQQSKDKQSLNVIYDVFFTLTARGHHVPLCQAIFNLSVCN